MKWLEVFHFISHSGAEGGCSVLHERHLHLTQLFDLHTLLERERGRGECEKEEMGRGVERKERECLAEFEYESIRFSTVQPEGAALTG